MNAKKKIQKRIRKDVNFIQNNNLTDEELTAILRGLCLSVHLLLTIEKDSEFQDRAPSRSVVNSW